MKVLSCSGLPAVARSAKVGAFVLGCSGALVLAAQGQPPVGPSGTGLIAGRVIDVTSGQPIPEATVSLRWLDGVRISAKIDAAGRVTEGTRTSNRSVVADSQGRFFFSGLLPGNYTTRTQLQGYTSLGSAYVEVGPDDRKLDIPLRLGRRGSLAGTVRDDAGDPVVGAAVLVFLKTTLGGRSPMLMPRTRGYVLTDDQGRYRVGELDTGDYLVCVCGSEAPLLDSILLTTLSPPALTAEELSQRTDRTIKTFAPTFYPGRTKASEASLVAVNFSDDRSGIDISLTAISPRRVSGRLMGESDVDLGAFALSLIGAGDLPGAMTIAEFRTTPGAPNGQFEFIGVPPGKYTLLAVDEKAARDAPRLWASQVVIVGDEDIRGVAVALRAGVTFSGRVEYAGRGLRPTDKELAGARVSLVPIDLTPAVLSAIGSTGRVGHGAQIEANGSFRITDIIPGRYLMQGATVPPQWMAIGSINAGGTYLPDTVVTVDETDLTDVLVTVVDTPMGTVEGTVTLREYDFPQEILACLFPANRALWPEPFRALARFACQAVSATNTYSLAAVPPGDYFLALRHTWLTDWTAPRQLEALARTATRVTARTGETVTIDLKR